jgi:hypothetical protein
MMELAERVNGQFVRSRAPEPFLQELRKLLMGQSKQFDPSLVDFAKGEINSIKAGARHDSENS